MKTDAKRNETKRSGAERSGKKECYQSADAANEKKEGRRSEFEGRRVRACRVQGEEHAYACMRKKCT